MVKWKFSFGILILLLILYFIFFRGFDEYKTLRMPVEWEGCYSSKDAGFFNISNGYLVFSEGSVPQIHITRSRDNQGDFLILNPSVYFEIREKDRKYLPRVGFSKFKGLGVVHNDGVVAIEAYSVDGKLITFVRGQCE